MERSAAAGTLFPASAPRRPVTLEKYYTDFEIFFAARHLPAARRSNPI